MFSRMRRTGGLGEPTAFCVLSSWLFGAIGLVIESVLDPAAMGEEWPLVLAFMGAALVLVPVVVIISLGLTAAIHHGMLWLVGGARFPFETTFRAVAYASGCAAAVTVVPGNWGALVSTLAQIVLAVVGLAKAHEIATTKALAAVLLPVLLCIAMVGVALWQLESAGLWDMLEWME
jgi:hypothetical protein